MILSIALPEAKDNIYRGDLVEPAAAAMSDLPEPHDHRPWTVFRQVHARESWEPVLPDAPLQIKHIVFARLMMRFTKWGSRFRFPTCLQSYELFR